MNIDELFCNSNYHFQPTMTMMLYHSPQLRKMQTIIRLQFPEVTVMVMIFEKVMVMTFEKVTAMTSEK